MQLFMIGLTCQLRKNKAAQEDQWKDVSMQMLLLEKLPIFLTCQSTKKSEQKALASFFPICLPIS